MRNIVGNWVDGSDFFDRLTDLAQLRDESMRHDILLLAPRRVGKTSLLRRFVAEVGAEEGLHAIYVDVQAARDERDFLRALAAELDDQPEVPWSTKAKQRTSRFFGRARELTVGAFSVSLDETPEDDWVLRARELEEALSALPGHWFFLVDEVPVLVLRLLAKEDGARRAREFLEWWRALRQRATEDVETAHWILAGSIGLDTVAARHGMSAAINDLHTQRLGPFARADARAFIRALCTAESLALDDPTIDHLLDRVGWLIPFHLQLVFSKLRERARAGRTAARGPDEVEAAIEETLTERKDFASWDERLADELGEEHARRARLVLASCARDPKGALTSTLGAALAKDVRHEVERARELRFVLDVLETDGYLVRDGKRWRFASPLLRAFWLRRYV